KIVPKMKDPAFMQSFLDKGRMEAVLKDMPVKIVLNDDCGIIGAARYTLVQKAFRTVSRASDQLRHHSRLQGSVLEIRLESDSIESRLDFRVRHEELPNEAGPVILNHHDDEGLIESHVNVFKPLF